MFYSPSERSQRTTPVYGPAPYELPWSERPGADQEPRFSGWDMTQGRPASPDGFRQRSEVDPEIAAATTAARAALDAERANVRAILGLGSDEPLDHLTFGERVEAQRMRSDLALNDPSVDQLSGERQPAPQPLPVAVGELAMAGATA